MADDTTQATNARDHWARGPWDAEPDKLVWVDEATDLDCMIVRNAMGALCGYVGVPTSHPWHGLGYNDCTLRPACEDSWCDHGVDVDVHGGLTYADVCDEQGHICHAAAPGRDPHVWWFGFDCAHAGDLVPQMQWTSENVLWPTWEATGRPDLASAARAYHSQEVYRNIDYVAREVTRAARQLKEVGK